MFTIYESKQERDDAWMSKHLAEHPACNLLMDECSFYTDAFLTDYAFAVLEDSSSYDRLFKPESRWYDSQIFVDSRINMIENFPAIDARMSEYFLRVGQVEEKYRFELLGHVLERYEIYDVYDIACRLHADRDSVKIHQTPMVTVLLNKIDQAVFYIMIQGKDISKYS